MGLFASHAGIFQESVCQPCGVVKGHLEQGAGASLRWREMMSGKALWVGLVGYIRCGSTKGVPLGGVLKEKGIPEETNTGE